MGESSESESEFSTGSRANSINGVKHVVSYGVICCRKNTNTGRIEALLVSKRYTYEFFEFVLCKVFAIGKKIPADRVINMLCKMTLDEKLDILSLNFDQMWYRICGNGSKNTTYYRAKAKFEQIFLSDGGSWITSMISKSTNADRIWEIPKGRRNTQEPEINCAVREFYEETNIEKKYYRLLPNIKRSYTFEDAGVLYTFVYYVGVTRRVIQPRINMKNKHQLIEINNIKWMDLDTIDAMDSGNRLRKFLQPIFKTVKAALR